MRWSVVLLAVGCGAPAQVATTRATPPPGPVGVQLGTLRLLEDVTLDYERPMAQKPALDRSSLVRRYVEACRSGDRPACWIAIGIDPRAGTMELLREHCSAGDVMSCRALPPDAVATDAQILRRECDGGHTRSCIELLHHAPALGKRTLEQRIFELTLAGCQAGVLSECDLIDPERPVDAQLAADATRCLLRLDRCARLGGRYRGGEDRVRAREAFERACQYGPDPRANCVELGLLYRERWLDEPVAGRGRALLAWACANGSALAQRYELCTGDAAPAARSHAPSASAEQLFASAETMLQDSFALDNQRPFANATRDVTRVRERYLDACRAGHARACWIAMRLDGAVHEPAARFVRDNCLAGDTLSCRALPDDMLVDAPGGTARERHCVRSPDESHCDLHKLRRECVQGFAKSCHRLWSVLAARPDDPHEVGMVATLAVVAAQVGCAAGIVDECGPLHWIGTDPDMRWKRSLQELQARQRYCALVAGRCAELAPQFEASAPVVARTLYELDCQRWPDSGEGTCLRLGRLYVERALPEPASGRGMALIRWACQRHSRDVADEKTCKLARP